MKTELLYGDSRSLMLSIEKESIDLIVTSPPYDNLRNYNGSSYTWRDTLWQEIIVAAYRVLKTGGVMVWVVGDATINGSETGTSFKQALFAMDAGFRLHDTMIYNKKTMPKNHNRYEQDFEYMFVLSKGKPKTFNPIIEPCKYAGQDKSARTMRQDGDELGNRCGKGAVKDTKIKGNIWRILPDHKSKHPAIFPLALARDHILSWSDEGDTVLDMFMGSGTTGVACINTGRNFIGIEQDLEYMRIAEKRIREAKDAL